MSEHRARRPWEGITLTEDFERALEILHGGGHLFLTGRAGTGKSTLIRHFLATTDRTAVTVAPTGIAALNVDGYTIHRLFSFPMGVNEDLVRGSGYYPGRFASTLAGLDTLIVDEASMVRADLFDALVAALERFGPQPGEPLGGVQLVLVGDLHQLPPVVRDDEVDFFDERYGTPYFFSARRFDRDTFPVVELTTVFRQVGDTQLVDILNAVRDGALLEGARAALNARTHPGFEPPHDEFWLTLATTNRIVGARNRRELERLPSPLLSYQARLTGDTDGFELPAESSLDLAVGAQVMLLNNDPADRWVNGTLGRILLLQRDEDGPVATVLLRDGRQVRVRAYTWEITRPVVAGGSLQREVVGTFTQLPMKLAWAITIHKAQGQTLDRVVVDLTGGTFANGQLYVALSRCTSLEGLVLRRDVLPRDLKTDGRIRRFLAVSRTGAGDDARAGHVYMAALTVGTAGDRYRPRPVEIAVVTDEGDEATTVINPTSDLYEAQTQFGLTTRDVQLAPVLAEAWACLSPLLAGRVPVGVGIDRTLGWIDFELKRNGVVEPMALGVELPLHAFDAGQRAGLAAPTALERARALRDAGEGWLDRGGDDALEAGTPFADWPRGHGFLQARVVDAREDGHGFVVGGNLSAEDDPSAVLAALLVRAWGRVIDRDAAALDRIRAAERHFGVEVLPADLELDGPVEASEVLVPGARVCFTGTVVAAGRGVVDRERMMRLAEEAGLVPVPTVTKTRTDVLVVAARGTQSGKARKALEWGKPVIAAEDFLAWVEAGA
ncbi:AAA family ATPase [Demequina mangrovi]|uniref:Helicase n=1 Tax=Demequina mangrovi TaxID=1043493 RepID=A0A1H6Y7Q2_9MICO|nr:AAA family ATPase [Demequina mangrovi]SEJ37313.1 Helicase [Demequina mangrovi]